MRLRSLPLLLLAFGCGKARVASTPTFAFRFPSPGDTLVEGRTYTIRWGSAPGRRINLGAVMGGHDKGQLLTNAPSEVDSLVWAVPPGFVTGFGVPSSNQMRLRLEYADSVDQWVETGPFIITGAPERGSIAWASWTVADTGFGPITIGMPAEQANAAVGGALELPPARTDGGCAYAKPRGIDSLTFMVEGGKIVRVDVRRHDIQTTAGARVGDSEARIQQLYPGHVRVSPHKYTKGHYLTVVPSDTSAHRYRVIFETDAGVVTRFRGGALPQVEYVEGCS